MSQLSYSPSNLPVFMFCLAVSGDQAGKKHDATDTAIVEA